MPQRAHIWWLYLSMYFIDSEVWRHIHLFVAYTIDFLSIRFADLFDSDDDDNDGVRRDGDELVEEGRIMGVTVWPPTVFNFWL